MKEFSPHDRPLPALSWRHRAMGMWQRPKSSSCLLPAPAAQGADAGAEDGRAPLLKGGAKRRKPWLGRRSPLHAFVRWRGRRVTPWPLEGWAEHMNGGFFESFGTVLQKHEEERRKEEEVLEGVNGSNGVDESANGEAEDIDGDATAEDGGIFTPSEDSQTSEQEADKADLISAAMGWNIEELYVEVLYETLYIIGSDSNAESEKAELLTYLQEAFKLDEDKHQELLERARAKAAPNILLNVEVVEATQLHPKDANGLCDPFCTLYLNSANTQRYNTSVKSKTLNPKWEEHFSLPVENVGEDVLSVEVWDFDPAETVGEKMSKFGEVKGMKGLSQLMKEIAVTVSTGKHDNEFVGSAQIPLKTIPAAGQLLLCHLERKGKARKQGTLKLRLALGAEKNTQVAFQEHRHIVNLLLLHHIETSQVAPYQWDGTLPSFAQTILTQHFVQSGLDDRDADLAKWVEYASIHLDHPISFRVFAGLLGKLVKPLCNNLLCEENMFWDAVKKLLPSCLNSIRKLRKLTSSDKHTYQQLVALLSILSELRSLPPPENFELFPSSVYGWLAENENKDLDILGITKLAITQGAIDWYTKLKESHTCSGDTENQINQLNEVVHQIRLDLQKATEFYNKVFQEIMQIPYAQLLYSIYESEVTELVEPVVTEVCDNLKPLKFDNEFPTELDGSEQLKLGTKLFELYLNLQRFAMLGRGLSESDASQYRISEFHNWFHKAVSQWLDMALVTALQRIKKAVELDKLVPDTELVKHSSSAVDTLTTFYQIKTFWNQLSWPEVEGSYTFLAKIIDDICRCSVFYADKMSEKVEGFGETQNVYEKKFEVTKEWCLAINNIDYVCRSIVRFVNELGVNDIINQLTNFKNSTTAEHCKRTLQLVIDNTVDTVSNKISDLMDIVAAKMLPSMNVFLKEGAELLKQDNNRIDRLMSYLENSLSLLHSELNCENFDRIFAMIWDNLALTLSKIVQCALEQRRPPSYFTNLKEILNILIGFFHHGDEHGETCNIEVLKDVEELLALHSMETWQLVHKFYLERLAEQQALESAQWGLLTVKAQFVEDSLRIQILSARNLHPMDNNGSCDPYVKIHLLPGDKFIGSQKPRTKTQKKTLFPLFDETFSFILSSDQKSVQDGMVLFSIKDSDFLGNEFVGEAYIPFSEIVETEVTKDIEELPQIHLKLTIPKNLDSRISRVLDHRQGDKLAKDFMKKQRAKISEKLH